MVFSLFVELSLIISSRTFLIYFFYMELITSKVGSHMLSHNSVHFCITLTYIVLYAFTSSHTIKHNDTLLTAFNLIC